VNYQRQLTIGPFEAPAMRLPRVRLTTRRIALAALVALYLLAVEALHARDVAVMFGGSDGFDVVRHPTKVEAYRLGRLPEGLAWHHAKPTDYPVLAGPVPVPARVASDVAAVLPPPRTFLPISFVKNCSPAYGVRLAVHRGADQVDVLLCYACGMLRVARNGVFTGDKDFDGVMPALVRAAKAVFPDDPVIRGLDERSGGRPGV
jgi:hypothetical protein